MKIVMPKRWQSLFDTMQMLRNCFLYIAFFLSKQGLSYFWLSLEFVHVHGLNTEIQKKLFAQAHLARRLGMKTTENHFIFTCYYISVPCDVTRKADTLNMAATKASPSLDSASTNCLFNMVDTAEFTSWLLGLWQASNSLIPNI